MARLVLALCSLIWVRAAEARTVAIVSDPSTDPLLVELVSRLHGELLAVNLEVVRLTRQIVAEPRRTTIQAWLERGGGDAAPDAVIEVLGDTPPFVVQVWLHDATARSHTRSLLEVASSPHDPPEKLAIRATEVLRSALLEADLVPRDPDSTPSDVPPVPDTHERDSAPVETVGVAGSALGIAAGATSVFGVDGVGPAIMPLVRLDLSLAPRLTLHATLAGLGTRPVVESATDSARLQQTQALVGFRCRFDATKALQPFLGLAVGALGTAITGRTRPPAEAHDDHQWSMLFEALGGADVHLFEHFYATLAGHVQLAEPSVAIHLLDTQVATTGHPNLGLSLSLGAWL